MKPIKIDTEGEGNEKKYEYLKKNMLVEVTLFQDHVPLRMRPDEETGQTDKHLFSTAPPVSNTRGGWKWEDPRADNTAAQHTKQMKRAHIEGVNNNSIVVCRCWKPAMKDSPRISRGLLKDKITKELFIT